MKRLLLVAVLLGLAAVVASSAVAPPDCNSPPMPPNGHLSGPWWRQYADWCSACGGTPDATNGCKRGPNWGRRGGSSPSSSSDADYEAERQRQEAERRRLEAERQRQREIEAQSKREEEEAKQRFERNKRQILQDAKGISESEFGLKGLDTGDGLDLKDGLNSIAGPEVKKPDCRWGGLGASAVDLRCLGLDPDKPIAIDPHVVRGQQRVFPAQIDPATFKNANYNKGFEALMRMDVASAQAAVEYFQQAQSQRPDDPLVRNALLLAEDILKARQQKEQEEKAQAMQSLYHGVAALLLGDVATAGESVERAQKLDPTNSTIGSWAGVMWGLSLEYKEAASQQKKQACQLVGNALIFESRGDIRFEILALETAVRLVPDDGYVKRMLWRAHHLAPADPNQSSAAPAAK